jgi:hypothetical protein
MIPDSDYILWICLTVNRIPSPIGRPKMRNSLIQLPGLPDRQMDNPSRLFTWAGISLVFMSLVKTRLNYSSLVVACTHLAGSPQRM